MTKPLTIVLAPDSFKECMTAKQACEAMARGIQKADPSIKCIQVPMADGGEGTLQALVDATGGTIYETQVLDPLGRLIQAQYGILGDGETGVLEMASASGLHLVANTERNPMVTTTFGTGQLIKACLDKGVKRLVIGIGGSATNDGGAGALQALGVHFLDDTGTSLPFGGGSLDKLMHIDLSEMDKRLLQVSIEVACDVTNPLCGANGASAVFGPQKGASPEMVSLLDANLKHYAQVIETQLGITVADKPGAGAAGGLGAGLMAFLNAQLLPGVTLVSHYAGLERHIICADMVWTGEGRLDNQTQFGKTPFGVAQLAKQHHKPVIGFAGQIGSGADVLYSLGIDAYFSIANGVMSLEEALANGECNLESTVENVARLIRGGKWHE